jgi:hypothetical protein
MLWKSAKRILDENSEEAASDYVEAMEKLAEISGAGKLTPP